MKCRIYVPWSEHTARELTVSEHTVSEHTVSEYTVSEHTVSEYTVSELTVSEHAVSEYTVVHILSILTNCFASTFRWINSTFLYLLR